MLDGRRRTISLCMNIDGFVRNNRYPRDYDIFQRDDGTPLTPAEARTLLALEKAKGHHVIPISAECGNPCKHANNGCTGFDYGERGGCPGRFTDGVNGLVDCGECRTEGCRPGRCRNAGVGEVDRG